MVAAGRRGPDSVVATTRNSSSQQVVDHDGSNDEDPPAAGPLTRAALPISTIAQTRPLLLLDRAPNEPAQFKRDAGSSPVTRGASHGFPSSGSMRKGSLPALRTSSSALALSRSPQPRPTPHLLEDPVGFLLHGQVSVRWVVLSILVLVLALWYRT